MDIRSVGPGIWNDWKGVLLRNLYQATANYLEGKDELDPAARANAAIEQLKEKLPEKMAHRISPIFEDLPQNYWLSFDMADLIRHARFFDQVTEDGVETAVQTRLTRKRDITELWVLTRDRSGLFADLTKAISSCGASIVGALLNTSDSGRVMNIFYLQNTEGLAFGRQSNHALELLRKRAQSAAEGDVENLSIQQARKSLRAGAIPVKPKVRFPKNKSSDTTILEIQGRDRPGLLHDIATILSEAEVEILSAHIEVVGTTAIDSFYLCIPGQDCELPERTKKTLKNRLKALLMPQDAQAA